MSRSGTNKGTDNTTPQLSSGKAELFPMFLKLKGRRCLVVGAGKSAEDKISVLLGCGADVVVVAPVATPTIQLWTHDQKLHWVQRKFEPRDLEAIFLVIVATSSKVVNRSVFEESQRTGVLCNAVHDRAHCDFYWPAVVRRGPLQIAISTAGHSGALAQRLRIELENQFGPEWENWLRWLGEARTSLQADPLSPTQRRTLLHKLAGKKTQDEFFRRWGVFPKKKTTS